MSEHFAVGVAGCGKIANDRHIPALNSLPHTDVVAVYDHRWENAEHSADTYDIPRVYDDIGEFVAGELDFVTVCTPPFVHGDVAVPAMEAGVDVLTEKPMAVDLEDADEMIRTAEETDRTLGVVHNFLYSTSVREAKDLIRSGELGEIQYVKGVQLSSAGRELPSWYTELPGGLFFDESPHLLYLMEEFVGELSVRGTELQPSESPRQLDSVTATYRGDSGIVAQMSMVFTAPVSEWFLIVVGSERVLAIDVFRDILVQFRSDRSHSPVDVVRTAVSGMAQFSLGMLTSGIATVRGELFFGYDVLANEFAHTLRSDRSPPVSGTDGKRILEYIYDTLDAGETGSGTHD